MKHFTTRLELIALEELILVSDFGFTAAKLFQPSDPTVIAVSGNTSTTIVPANSELSGEQKHQSLIVREAQ